VDQAPTLRQQAQRIGGGDGFGSSQGEAGFFTVQQEELEVLSDPFLINLGKALGLRDFVQENLARRQNTLDTMIELGQSDDVGDRLSLGFNSARLNEELAMSSIGAIAGTQAELHIDVTVTAGVEGVAGEGLGAALSKLFRPVGSFFSRFLGRAADDLPVGAIDDVAARSIAPLGDNFGLGSTAVNLRTSSSALNTPGALVTRLDDSALSIFRITRRVPGSPGLVTGGNSTVLRANLHRRSRLGGPATGGNREAHHVIPSAVAKDHPVLKRLGINLDDASNGVFLPNGPNGTKPLGLSVHRGPHDNYSRAIQQHLDSLSHIRNLRTLDDKVSELQTRLREALRQGAPLRDRDGATIDLWLRIARGG
jgi:hypothetical protein